MTGRVPFRAPTPELPTGIAPVLADVCRAAVAGVNDAWDAFDRASLVETVRIGADGTATYRLDDVVEARIIEAVAAHGLNLLSEEAGFVDTGSAATVVVDPIDGSANAAAGVPLSCCAAAIYVDGEPMEAVSLWLENGFVQWAKRGADVPYRTSGVQNLDGAAVSMLRPKQHAGGDSTAAWLAIAARAARVRVLSSSCLEAMLVAAGSTDAFADPGSETHRLVDLAAASLIVPAAGGVVVDAFERPIEFDVDLARRWSGVVAATPELADELAAAIRAASVVPV